MIIALLGIVVLVALCALLARVVASEVTVSWPRRLRRRPRDLRGDWWAGFEAELRAYERRRALADRSGRDPNHWRPPPR